MRRFGGSISLRLAVGFMLVLAVFGAALLFTLYNLDKVKDASEQIRIRQEIRREALQVGRLAEELFVCQQEFTNANGVEWSDLNRFHDLYRRMEEKLQSLLSRPVDKLERGYLEELGQAARRLRTIFVDRTVTAKMQADMGVVPALDLADLEEQSLGVLAEINDLNDSLGRAFEMRTERAEDEARWAWKTSLDLSNVIFPLALMIGLLIIYYTHRSIVRPVGTLLDGTHALASGELSSRIEVADSGEFRELAESFNRMAGALEANQKQLIESERMAGIGRLAAGVAHEINNPIAVILGYAQMLLDRMPAGAPQRAQLQTMAEEARQCKEIVDGLLDLSRPSDPTRGEVINPGEVVADIINSLQVLQLAEGVRIDDSVVDRSLPLAISRPRLRQLIFNIVRNALEVLQESEDGQLRVEGYVRPREKLEDEALKDASPDTRSFLVINFIDNGPGISPESQERLFEPFFTTKVDGMGLGLAISHNIARAHGGFIRVQSALGEGTTFTVGIPIGEEP
ncbi:MAG: sensor histidine kinase [Planctomycetota bacterium]|jgi:signal transduction histidine kinase